ncbi:peptide ABC transporter permease [Vulcanibacillus modesticaldus]|uniref:Peptide ABC transporter permease n=1 Tax=Vulcanibacillus modesticaldus TaxID=337097 RepID=A0A1D2YUK0_9BACI|nr:ABC transporter permease [Vulcanibacillus modesticaldus]OEF99384.1 peptide ABC transporter permease [Vulcanibacillus modesticaldus]
MSQLEISNDNQVYVNTPNDPSPLLEVWRRLKKHKLAMLGGAIIISFIIIALFAPLLTSYPYDGAVLEDRFLPPLSEGHIFGTDDLGRDLFSRIVYGAQISLRVGFLAVVGSVIIGTILGLLAGYYGKWIDMLISRIFDIMLAFPSILLAIAIVTILGRSLTNALLAIAIVNIPTYGRLVRSKVLSLKEEEFVMAAKALGMKNRRIILHHLLPNSLTPVIVQGTLGIATAIIETAALGFLGLGAQPPTPEWGTMLADSKDYIQLAPWTVVLPGISIMLVVLGFNLFGDGLRDVLDPKMKQ